MVEATIASAVMTDVDGGYESGQHLPAKKMGDLP